MIEGLFLLGALGALAIDAKTSVHALRRPFALDLFAGGGGASLGLRQAGFTLLAVVERDNAAAATLRAAGFPVLHADLQRVIWAGFPAVDLCWASPPCTGVSVASSTRRGPVDPRDGWPVTIATLDALPLSPTWFVAETVLGATAHVRCGALVCPRCALDRVVEALRLRFAAVEVWTLDAADFGVPQRRRRLFVVAGPEPLSPPVPTHGMSPGLLPRETLRSGIGDTLNRDSCRWRVCFPCGQGRACSEPWRLDLPSPTVMTTEVKGTRASADGLLLGTPDRVSDAAFLTVGARRITVEEALRLQGFSDAWPLQGTVEQRYTQVGNAVPPPLAAVVARTVRARLSIASRA